MRSVNDMTDEELANESVRLNCKIMCDTRHSWSERRLAAYKLNAPKRMNMSYLHAMRALYGE